MAVFVHEFFCSGAFSGEFTGNSLAREGLAMLRAAVEDFARLTSERAVTTLDRRLFSSAGQAPFADCADVRWTESPDDEKRLFPMLAAESEATFVIAPETDGHLLARRKLVDAVGGRFLGPSADAIQLCGDKLLFCEHLAQHGLPTIPTTDWDASTKKSPFPFPIVIKPRDGAGSQATFLIRGRQDLESLSGHFASRSIVQPFIEGKSLSTAAVVDGNTSAVQVFPIGEQHLSRDDRFCYQGGRIPAELNLPENISQMIVGLCRSIPGLAGYIGIDLVLARGSQQVLIVEANPRLTTAYLGYRALSQENLTARILEPGNAPSSLAWSAGSVVFRADGRASFSAPGRLEGLFGAHSGT